MNIKITIGQHKFEAKLYNTPTAKVIFCDLPQSATVNVWGNEIYFPITTICDIEPNAKTVLEIGDLAYYPPMKAFCIFFGKTLASTGEKPEAAGPVNVFGSILNTDVEALRQIADGNEVKIESL